MPGQCEEIENERAMNYWPDVWPRRQKCCWISFSTCWSLEAIPGHCGEIDERAINHCLDVWPRRHKYNWISLVHVEPSRRILITEKIRIGVTIVFTSDIGDTNPVFSDLNTVKTDIWTGHSAMVWICTNTQLQTDRENAAKHSHRTQPCLLCELQVMVMRRFFRRG